MRKYNNYDKVVINVKNKYENEIIQKELFHLGYHWSNYGDNILYEPVDNIFILCVFLNEKRIYFSNIKSDLNCDNNVISKKIYNFNTLKDALFILDNNKILKKSKIKSIKKIKI